MVIFHDTSNDIGSFTKDVVAKLHLSEDKIPNLEPFPVWLSWLATMQEVASCNPYMSNTQGLKITK